MGDDKFSLVIDPDGHTGIVRAITYTPDGRFIVTASEDKTIRVWDRFTGRTVRVIRGPIGPGPEGRLYALAISPDGKFVVTGGYGVKAERDRHEHEEYILIFNIDGRLVKKLFGHSKSITALAFSPDGKYLASGSADKTVIIWHRMRNDMWVKIHTLEEHEDIITGLAFFDNSSKLVSSSYDTTLKVWDVRTGKRIRTLARHSGRVRCVSVSVNGVIASGSDDQTIKLWKDEKFLGILPGHRNNVDDLAFTPDGNKLVSCGRDFRVLVWNVVTKSLVKEIGTHTNTVHAIAVSPDGKEAVSAGGDFNEIVRWDLNRFRKISEWKSKGRDVKRVGFSNDGRAIAFGYDRKGSLQFAFHFDELTISKAQDVNFRKEITHKGNIKLIIDNGQLKAEIGDQIRTITQNLRNDRVIAATLTPDLKHVIVGTRSGLFRYNLNGKLVQKYRGHNGEVWSIVVSPDAKFIVSGGGDQTVRLWDIETGELILTLFYSVEDSEWVVVTSDGYYVSSPRGDRYVGWVENRGLEREAVFYRLSSQRKKFYNPDKVREFILNRKGAGIVIPSEHIEIEFLDLKYNDRVMKPKVTLKIRISVPGNSELMKVHLYINGSAEKTWDISELPDPVKIGNRSIYFIQYELEFYSKENIIEVWAESDIEISEPKRIVLYFEGKLRELRKNLFVLAVGISNYKNIDNLSYAHTDASAIAELFETQKGSSLFSKVYIRSLINEQATRERILEELESIDSKLTPRDLFILFLAGHGQKDERGRYYFLTYNSDRKRLLSTAIPGGFFTDYLGRTPGKLLIIVDTCFSGGVSNQKVRYRSPTTADMLAREFIDAGEQIAVITAATDKQFSAELKVFGHGILTQAILEALRDGKATAPENKIVHFLEFHAFTSRRVFELAEEYGLEQTPVFSAPKIQDFPFFEIKRHQ